MTLAPGNSQAKATVRRSHVGVDERSELAKLNSPNSGAGSNIKYIVNATRKSFEGSIV